MVISGHYTKVEDGVVIELHGRMSDGRSATVLYQGFRPYFHIVEPDDDVLAELRNDPGVIEVSKRALWYDGHVKNCGVVTIKYPYEVPSYRKKLMDRGFTILAADIPFIFRFYYDLDLGSYLEVHGEEVGREGYTTDVVVSAEEIRRTEPFRIRLKVLSFDIENSIKSGELFMLGHSTGWLQLDDGDLSTGSIVPDEEVVIERERREEMIIRSFQELVVKEDPDIITGYNIDGYDIPHLIKRMEAIGIPSLNIGRDGTAVEKFGYRSWKARGRIILDAWWEAKTTFRPKKESLEAVSQLVLGEGKDEIDTSQIEYEWENRREEVIKYCEKDASLALRILDKTQSIKRGMALSYVAMLPLADILTGTTSNLIDSILIREADRADIGIPLTRHERKTAKIEGAYVHSVDPGLYHWVAVLDFRSMYPSLMIKHNICFTTLTRDPSEGEPSPIPNIYFKPRDVANGLVPGILKKLMEDRGEAKRNMKAATDPEEKEFYNGLQEALKVLMNSFYGVFASYFYRFTDRSIGSSITAYAREAITDIISTLQDEGNKVIYSDTDSIFIQSPFNDPDETIEFGRGLARRFSSGASVLEFEKVFSSFFTHGKKKRYVGLVVWPEESMVVRGYEMRRTDAFDLQSRSLSDVFKHILSGDIDGALDLSRDIIRRCREGEVENESLVISRSIQEVDEDRIREAYKNPDSMANVQALRKSRSLGLEMVPGMKISWIVTDAKAKPQRVEPYLDGKRFNYEPDYSYYAERLASTLSRVTEVFGVSEKELLTGSAQASLFDDFRTEERRDRDRSFDMGNEKGTDKKKKTTANSTLDSWM
ncbi:MAG: DNA-directed DNA polymerase [Thermoplasmatota archaeon]